MATGFEPDTATSVEAAAIPQDFPAEPKPPVEQNPFVSDPDEGAETDDGAEGDDDDAGEKADGKGADDDSGAGDSGLDASILSRAEEAGLTKEKAEALHEAGLLEAVLTSFDSRLVSIGRNPPAPDEAKGEKKADGKKAGDEPPELSSELYDEDLRGRLKWHSDREAAMVQRLTQLEDILLSQESEREGAETDKFVDGLGESWQPVFGKGSINDLPEHSAEAKNRVKLHEQMLALREAYRIRGVKMPNAKEIRNRALLSLFGDQAKENIHKELQSKASRSKQKRHISRPQTRRNGEQQADPNRGVRKVAQMMKERGLLDEDLGAEF